MQPSKLLVVAIVLLAICAIIWGLVIAYQLALVHVRPQTNLEAQKQCAVSANSLMAKLSKSLSPGSGSYNLQASHYNAALNKCFADFSFSSFGPHDMVNRGFALYDSLEERLYGNYLDSIDNREKSLLLCELFPAYDDSKKLTCKTLEEYRSFVARYME